MGSPIAAIVASLLMEEFEIKAINAAIHPLRTWVRYVDETFVIQKAQQRHEFLQHINSIDPDIQFTLGDPQHRWIHFIFGHLSHLDQTTHFSLQFTENQPIWTDTFVG